MKTMLSGYVQQNIKFYVHGEAAAPVFVACIVASCVLFQCAIAEIQGVCYDHLAQCREGFGFISESSPSTITGSSALLCPTVHSISFVSTCVRLSLDTY
jgi:hypothetical protein